jgi:phosphoribosylglycinamide formyltransferase-1
VDAKMTNNSTVRLGIIGSSGGSALAAASDCLISTGKAIEWVVITDRECGLEAWAKAKGHTVHRVNYRDASSFSSEACTVLCTAGCEDVLLFYTRRVASPLIDQLRVWNIHPALLPSFMGLHGVRDAMVAGVRLFGATLHHVDAGLDTGKIVAQVAAPLPVNYSQSAVDYLSFLQKVWLTLVWFEQLAAPRTVPLFDSSGPGVALGCPGIADERLRASYAEWLLYNRDEIKKRLR